MLSSKLVEVTAWILNTAIYQKYTIFYYRSCNRVFKIYLENLAHPVACILLQSASHCQKYALSLKDSVDSSRDEKREHFAQKQARNIITIRQNHNLVHKFIKKIW